jgi:hypothetical protein
MLTKDDILGLLNYIKLSLMSKRVVLKRIDIFLKVLPTFEYSADLLASKLYVVYGNTRKAEDILEKILKQVSKKHIKLDKLEQKENQIIEYDSELIFWINI